MDFFRRPPKRNVVDPLAAPETIPVGDVKETDWAEWEDSVAFQDSQLGFFQDTVKQPLAPEVGDLLDAFAFLKKKSP
jgi:hypothetical protein